MHVTLKGRAAQQRLPVSGPGPGSWNIDGRVSLPGAGSLGLGRRRSRRATLIFQTAISCLTNSRDWVKSRSHCLASTSSLSPSLRPFPLVSLVLSLAVFQAHSSIVCCLTLLPLTSLLLLFTQIRFLSLGNLWWSADAEEWGGGSARVVCVCRGN